MFERRGSVGIPATASSRSDGPRSADKRQPRGVIREVKEGGSSHGFPTGPATNPHAMRWVGNRKDEMKRTMLKAYEDNNVHVAAPRIRRARQIKGGWGRCPT